jgi:hypothetical protein
MMMVSTLEPHTLCHTPPGTQNHLQWLKTTQMHVLHPDHGLFGAGA